MTNEKMKRQLAAALEKTAPDDVDGVLSRCETRKGTVINMPIMKTAKRKWTILVAACLAVVLLAGGGVLYQQANAKRCWSVRRSTRMPRPSLRI